MSQRDLFRRRSIGAGLAVLAVGLLASGCDWYGFGFESSLNSDNAGDTAITPTNVSTLTLKFTAIAGSHPLQVEADVNGVLYAASYDLPTGLGAEDGTLYAFSAAGTTGCSGAPVTCAPLWSASLGIGTSAFYDLTVSNGVVYINGGLGLEAFDAAGQTNCSGTPTVCQPMWQASVNSAGAVPTVANGTVFVTSNGDLQAFDANGNTNCSGSPKVCAPIWTSDISAPNSRNAVTVSGGIAYSLSGASPGTGGNNSAVVALDANGNSGCSGIPRACTPLWEYPLTNPVNSPTEYVSVQGTTLYAGTWALMGGLHNPDIVGSAEAFDAKGVSGCAGTPVMCSPVWTSPNTFPSLGSPLVGDGFAFSHAFVGPSAAFSVNGSTNCSGTPIVCNPVWTASIGADDDVIPFAIGGSVLYAGGALNLYAFDASGRAGCAASVCSPLWSTNMPNGSVGFNSAIVANGTLYGGTQTPSSANGEVLSYGLP